jgi:hypothetical protein
MTNITEAMKKRNPTDDADNNTQGFLLFAYCSFSLQIPAVHISQPTALIMWSQLPDFPLPH